MSLRGKRSLIIGADGFVGRNLGRWLDERGYAWAGVSRAAGDLAETGVAERALAAAPPCDLVFHLVTRQRTGAVQYGIQGELLAINARIHLNVLEAWRRHQPQAKLISAGSSCTYPESAHPLPEALFGAPGIHPSVTGYAQAKLLLAAGAQAYAEQYGLTHLHCVLATLYGPGDHVQEGRSHFMGAMIDRAVREKAAGAGAFSVWGRPDVVRELLYVDDQIEAIVAAQARFSNRVLNCAAGQPVAIGQAAAAVLDALGWSIAPHYVAGTFQSAAVKVLDSTDFLSAVDWRPRWTLQAGVRAVLERDYVS